MMEAQEVVFLYDCEMNKELYLYLWGAVGDPHHHEYLSRPPPLPLLRLPESPGFGQRFALA